VQLGTLHAERGYTPAEQAKARQGLPEKMLQLTITKRDFETDRVLMLSKDGQPVGPFAGRGPINRRHLM
jgi:hypothetical protein